MSGILDSKSRVMDTLVTLEGRSQLSSANLGIKYVSFTDAGVYYAADIASGSADATTRIYLECCSLPQDRVTLEADDSGHLTGFIAQDGSVVNDGQVISLSRQATTSALYTGSMRTGTALSGDEFASAAGQILESSLENFSKLRAIATNDHIFEDDGFGVGNPSIEFVINETRPLPDKSMFSAHLENMESLYQDIRLSSVPNFKYLPPINKSDGVQDTSDYRNTTSIQLGHYPPWGRTHVDGLKPAQLESELQFFEKIGSVKTVVFEPTSMKNMLAGQFFEISDGYMTKLDVIDYGQYTWNNQKKHAFFVGKVMTDVNGAHTFVHIFTVVFG